MAHELGMTVARFLAETDSEEIAMWMARRIDENKQQNLNNLAARAHSLRRNRK